MLRFLLCSFALVLLYPTGIDLYLVGLPQIAQDLQASEPQLHIAFSIYLGGMAATMLVAAPSYCERYAQQLNLGLVTRPIPLAKEQQDKLIIPFTMIWHKRNAYSSKLKWLKHTIRSLYDSGEFGSGHLS